MARRKHSDNGKAQTWRRKTSIPLLSGCQGVRPVSLASVSLTSSSVDYGLLPG